MFSAQLSHPRLSVYQHLCLELQKYPTYTSILSYDDYCSKYHQTRSLSSTRLSPFPDTGFDDAMLDLSVFFRYWLFASAFVTIYIILDSLLGSVHGFMQLYYNWSECIAFTEDILYIGPTIRSIATAILALLFLKMQQACLSILWPKSWLPRSCVAKIMIFFALLIFLL